jgi:uncharacterized protein (TIRG00374 family)
VSPAPSRAAAAPSRPVATGSAGRSGWRQYIRPGVFLVVGGISLYLLLPGLLAVFGSWRSLSNLNWYFAALALAAQLASTACVWELDRIALRTKSWFAVACAQLAGNAVGRIVPGGGATATAFSSSMLRRAGVDTGEAAAGFTASSLLQLGTTLALPLLALPALVGGAPINHSLETDAYVGIGVLVLLIVIVAAALATDAPLELAGRFTQWLLNATVRRRRPVAGLPQELLADRDFTVAALGKQWKGAVVAASANTGFDYLSLLAALWAVGAHPRPSLVLLAFTAASLLSLIPFTPGGFGFVEVGLVGTLTLAGVSGDDALVATLLYRLIGFWLPIPEGGVAYVLFRQRYR